MLNRSVAREDPPLYNRPSQPYHISSLVQSRGRDNNSRPYNQSHTVLAPWAQCNSETVNNFSNTEVWEQKPPNLDLQNPNKYFSRPSDLQTHTRHLDQISDSHSRRRSSEYGKIISCSKLTNTSISNTCTRCCTY
jgi:hypothetical protein